MAVQGFIYPYGSRYAGGRIGERRALLSRDLRRGRHHTASDEQIKRGTTVGGNGNVTHQKSYGGNTFVHKNASIVLPITDTRLYLSRGSRSGHTFIIRHRSTETSNVILRIGTDGKDSETYSYFLPLNNNTVQLYHGSAGQPDLNISVGGTAAYWMTFRTYVLTVDEQANQTRFYADGHLEGTGAARLLDATGLHSMALGTSYGLFSSRDQEYQYVGFWDCAIADGDARYLSQGRNVFELLQPEWYRYSVAGLEEAAGPGDPADIDLPSKQVHVQGFAPSVDAPLPADIDLPSSQVHVQGFAPSVEVPSGADVGLPSKQVHVQGFVPSIDAPTDADIDLPSKQVHVQGFIPTVTVPSGADVGLPSKQVHVQGFAPNIDAPTDADVSLPFKQVHVQPFAPMIVTGDEDISLLPSTFVHVRGFAPSVDAPASVETDLPSKYVHVQGFSPVITTGDETQIVLPSKFINVQAFAPTVEANVEFIVNLPSKQIHVVAFRPRIQAGVEETCTLWESIESIKMFIKPKIEALGLSQIMWPNLPKKRDSTIPFVQVSINASDRELSDLGGVHRTIGTLVTVLHTPYGNDAGGHNKYVDGLMKMVSNIYLDSHILFFTSIPTTVGRRDSWWATSVETEFYLENV